MRLRLFNFAIFCLILLGINYFWGDKFYSLYGLFGSPAEVQSLLNSGFFLIAAAAIAFVFVRTLLAIVVIVVILLLIFFFLHYGVPGLF